MQQAPDVRPGLILLAAGASRRMGTPKQLLDFRGQPLVVHVVQTALAATCSPVVVVLGARAEAIRPLITAFPITIVDNRDWPSGMAGSVRTGLEKMLQLAPGVPSVLLMLTDQPLVDAALLNELMERKKTSGKKVVACGYNGTTGVPALFDADLFPGLMQLQGEEGARKIIRSAGEEVEIISFPPGGHDIDTPEDYAAITSRND